MILKPSTLQHLEELAANYPALAPAFGPITRAVELICDCHRDGGKILVAGNGGSAADSDHIVGELVKSFVLPRKIASRDAERLQESGCEDWQSLAGKLQRGIAAVGLTGNAALSTAIQNDTDAEMIFAQQVYVYGRPGDVLLVLSTSGRSRNILNALKVARCFGLSTIGLTSMDPAPMDSLCDALIKVPARETFAVQELHLPVYHRICLMSELELFGEDQATLTH